MTCIVGLLHNKTIYIGGDSAGSNSSDLRVRKDTKVFENGPFLMGFTTSFRMGQLLHWSFKPPSHPNWLSDEAFMNTLFVDAVRSCLKTGGFAKKVEDSEEGGTFIIGYRQQLYVMQADYQIGQYYDNFMAVGSGESAAMGCLFGTAGMKDPKKRCLLALQAAERLTPSVRGPFTILSPNWIDRDWGQGQWTQSTPTPQA